jgi:large subunit ribosomal protein L30
VRGWPSEREERSEAEPRSRERKEGELKMARLKVTQIRSTIGQKRNQRETVRTLGLKRINDVVVKEDRPEIRGMIFTVTHLVKVEEVE